MNSNVVKVKKVLEALLERAEKDDAEKIKIAKMYQGDYAADMLKKIKADFYQEFLSAQEQVHDICAKAIESVIEKDILCGDDITRDAELIADDSPFTLTKEQFNALVEKYAGKNNTMCVLLRRHYDKCLLDGKYLTINGSMHAGIATAKERIDSWKAIENGAISTLNDIYSEHGNTDGEHLAATKRFRLFNSRHVVESFMSTGLSSQIAETVKYC